jgi:hypothetical protein
MPQSGNKGEERESKNNLSIYGSITLMGLGQFFGFLILYTDVRTPWTGGRPAARPLPTHRTTQTENKRTQTSMLLVGFEATIPVFKRAKTVHALDRAATVSGRENHCRQINWRFYE